MALPTQMWTVRTSGPWSVISVGAELVINSGPGEMNHVASGLQGKIKVPELAGQFHLRCLAMSLWSFPVVTEWLDGRLGR